MARILILGAGVMGTAFAVPAADNGHSVRLVGTHLDRDVVAALKRPGGVHPKLDAPLPSSVEPVDIDDLAAVHLAEADVVVIGVASPGIDWAVDRLCGLLRDSKPVALLTKGLVGAGETVRTYAETVPDALARLERGHLVGIGGPCIARELANRWPTASVYGCADTAVAARLAALMERPFYRLSVSDDVIGVEACAALKNFFAIGASAMQTRYRDSVRGDIAAKNPTAAVFNQAAREMAAIAHHLGGRRETAFDLAGIGDLHVTVGGGRNSRLGHALGRGATVSAVMAGALAGETVEGIDTGRALAALIASSILVEPMPLAAAIIEAVTQDKVFGFDFETIGRVAA